MGAITILYGKTDAVEYQPGQAPGTREGFLDYQANTVTVIDQLGPRGTELLSCLQLRFRLGL